MVTVPVEQKMLNHKKEVCWPCTELTFFVL